jgi:hypothetical protein
MDKQLYACADVILQILDELSKEKPKLRLRLTQLQWLMFPLHGGILAHGLVYSFMADTTDELLQRNTYV